MSDCAHERTVTVSGKCSDMAHVRYHDGHVHSGYAPDFLGGGDYIKVTVCIDCHKATNFDRNAYNISHDELIDREWVFDE